MISRTVLLSACFFIAFTRCEFILSYFFLTDMSKVSDLLQKANGIFGSIFLLVIAFVQKGELKECIYALAEIDYRCKYYQLNLNFMRTTIVIWILMFTPCLLNISYMVYTIFGILIRNGIYPYLSECMAFFLPGLIFTAINMKFVSLLFVITEYIVIMNKVRMQF